MPFRYNPPTRTNCPVCENIKETDLHPIITANGKASAAANFPFHNWYYFVLGYTPEFPNYIIKRENILKSHFVIDPFMGSGTTLVCCKNYGIKSGGTEANNFFKFASDVKLNWSLNPKNLRDQHKVLMSKIIKIYNQYNWGKSVGLTKFDLVSDNKKIPKDYAKTHRPELLLEKYMCDNAFVKFDIIKRIISEHKWDSADEKDFFLLGLSSVIIPASNISYGPGFGVGKQKLDVDIISLFNNKINRMILDIEVGHKNSNSKTTALTHLGDARILSSFFDRNSIDFMITSPPYPGDHEYTKHSRLELILMDMATDLTQFRSIKKRMLRGSTTNIYKDDREGDNVKNIESINTIVKEIDKRLKEDGATSGFEGLYTKLIVEYFGGMYKTFQEALKVLKPGGKFILLVSDSHAFKMVHIKTADLLLEVARKVGFCNGKIELWQFKDSTSHKYKLLENILTLEKPKLTA